MRSSERRAVAVAIAGPRGRRSLSLVRRPMPTRTGTFQTVFSSADKAKAESVVEILRRAGYRPHSVSSRPSPVVSGCEAVYRVDIPADEFRAAREVLAGISEANL